MPAVTGPAEQSSEQKTAVETIHETPMRVGVLLFPEFEMLDVFGPVELLSVLNHFNRPTQTVMIAVDTSRPLPREDGEDADAVQVFNQIIVRS